MGVYMYHFGASSTADGDPSKLTTRPDRIRITSPSGDVAIAKVEDWLPTQDGEEDPFKVPATRRTSFGPTWTRPSSTTGSRTSPTSSPISPRS